MCGINGMYGGSKATARSVIIIINMASVSAWQSAKACMAASNGVSEKAMCGVIYHDDGNGVWR